MLFDDIHNSDTAVLTEAHPTDVKEARRILIVEDDQDQADVLVHRLEKQGFAVITTNSGLAALEIARTERVDLIVLDIRLPDLDGLQVCQQLSDDPATCCIPVIMLSGMERPDIVRRTRAAGCQYYVRKPYDPNALLLLIQNSVRAGEEW